MPASMPRCRRILVSPWFLFRSETESPDVPRGSTHPVNAIELASRLSFFLWSSIPDDELLEVAEQDRLTDPGVLEAQVRRMIADSRSDALVENFTGQWLQLRNLDSRVRPDLLMFPDFDDNLRQAMRRETEMLFGHVLRAGLPVHELMNASYHVPQRASGAPLRHRRRVRSAFPPRRSGGFQSLGACSVTAASCR